MPRRRPPHRPALQRSPAGAADDLPSIAGLDTKDGLARVGGNRKLYLKLLRQFIEQQGPAVEQIAEALAEGDIALAERLAHTLKGVAGNIGATEVRFAAGALEKLIRDRADAQDVDAARQQVAARLEPFVTELRAALDSIAAEAPAQSTTAAPADPAQSREAAAHLTALLSELRSGRGGFRRERIMRRCVRCSTSATWREFEQLVQGYAFADAQARLEQALERFSVH